MQVLRHLALVALVAMPTATFAHGGGAHLMGIIKVVNMTSLTMETPGKQEVTVLLNDKTRFERDGAPSNAKDLSAGERVVVHVAKHEGKGDPTAILVRVASRGAHLHHTPTGGPGAEESGLRP